MSAIELIRRLTRRSSVRRFAASRTIEHDHLVTILDCARWTGSARNRQPWQVVAVRDPQLRAQLSRLGAYADHVAAAPVVLVVLSADDGTRDTEFDVGRFTQSIILAAAALEIDSCLATLYPDDNTRVAAQLAGAGPGWVARHLISLGYRTRPAATGSPPETSAIPRGRRPVAEILREL